MSKLKSWATAQGSGGWPCRSLCSVAHVAATPLCGSPTAASTPVLDCYPGLCPTAAESPGYHKRTLIKDKNKLIMFYRVNSATAKQSGKTDTTYFRVMITRTSDL